MIGRLPGICSIKRNRKNKSRKEFWQDPSELGSCQTNLNTDQMIHNKLKCRIRKLHEDIQKKEKILEQISFINSHQIRRPVTNILGLLSVIDNHQKDSTCLESSIDQIKISANELDKLTRQIEKLRNS